MGKGRLATEGIAGMLLACFCYGQTLQPPATADDLKYFRFLLMQVGSVDHHAGAKSAFENNLVRQFGLNSQEVAVIRAAGQELQTLLQQLRQPVRSVTPDRTGSLSTADKATISALTAQREQKIEALANRLLNQVRPETAARLRLPGRQLANRGVSAAAR